jgi:hypothetical protein
MEFSHIPDNFNKNKILHVTDKVRRTCTHIHKKSQHVKINENKLRYFIKEKKHFFNQVPSWTSSHFNPNDFHLEQVLAFICVIDSLNFCFWPYENIPNKPEEDFEYGNLVNNLLNLLKNEPEFFNPENLSNLTPEICCQKIFNSLIDFPLIEERTRSLNELGKFINSKYESKFSNFLIFNKNDCVEIVKSITEGVTTFRDETFYKGKQIFFYKRAQILAADLYYACRELEEPIILSNAKELTMFADYRIPQILNEYEILVYDDQLTSKIINKIELSAHSQEEIEIRANTVVCVEMIKEEINKIIEGKQYLSLEIDYVLWTIGEELRKEIQPHHRTLSIFY